MDTERKRVLQMLKEGVIDTEEAERLLDSLGSNQPPKAEPVTETVNAESEAASTDAPADSGA